MTLRGKLNLPEFVVKFDGEGGRSYEGNSELEEKVVDLLSHLAEVSCVIANNNEKKAMDVYADLISMLYKLPMFVSYAPITEGKYLPTAFEYFFVYVVARHVKDMNITVKDTLQQVLEKIEDFNHIDTIRELIRDYFYSIRDVYEALLETPADTRPGFNFTSLASHIQLTSLMTWLLQPGSYDLNYLRVAALLHDIGKLFNPRHHVQEALDIMRELENRTANSCIKLGRVKELVVSHHGDFESIISKADRLAASADRLSDLVNEALKNDGKEAMECFSKQREESFDCFDKLGREKYEKLSKELYTKILSYLLPEDIIENNEAKVFPFIPEKVERVQRVEPKGRLLGYIAYVDFPGIQKFIFNYPKIRDMSFASMLVDFLVSVYPFIVLDTEYSKRTKSRLPAEALLSGYGGHSYIVIRKDMCEKDCVSEIKELFKELPVLKDLDVQLSVSVSDFAYEDYIVKYNEIWDNIKAQFYERYLADFEEEVYSVGLHRVCDNCGVRPAVDKDEEEYLCRRCLEMRKLSKTRGFMSKAKSTYSLKLDGVEKLTPEQAAKAVFGDNYGEYAMEFLAGYTKVDDSKYVSLIKADGNRGSVIFSSSATFSDFLDRSFRLDYGVKKAFYETISELADKEKSANSGKFPLTSAVLSGVLYLGGDDIFIITPAIVSLPFAVKLFERAKQYSGFTFKVGIVTVKPDHPIQFAFQAAEELMENSKIRPPENVTRKEAEKYNKTSIGCVVFSSTLASRSVMVSELKKYKRNDYSYMVVANDIEAVKSLLQLAKLYDFSDVVKLYLSKDNRQKVRERLRQLEDIVGYAEQRLDKPNNFLMVIAYILRKIAKSDEGYDKELLKKLVSRKDGVSDPTREIPLYDYYFMMKNFRVGVG
jgi:HD superfamily phosphodiesterase